MMLAVCLFTFVVFAYDKGCAGRGARRISERTLFLLMSLGGSPGGWLAMLSLHHKNRKTSFRSVALLIVLVQIAALAAAAHEWLQTGSLL